MAVTINKWLIGLIFAIIIAFIASISTAEDQEQFFKRGHTNNWAVLVCTSRYWFNYRHIANTLSIYRSVKRLGIPDSQIILMLADDVACDPRNSKSGTVYNNANQQINVYGDDIEVDYRGYEVTVENLVRVLTGRLPDSVPRSKRLLTDERSNVLVYMTGHGGNGFLKFQDAEEISDVELANAFEQMWQKRRYHEIFFAIDTCQAASMLEKFYSPNILGVASSLVGEDSHSHHHDPEIGVAVIDSWTYYTLSYLERIKPTSKDKMYHLLQSFDKSLVMSTTKIRTDLYKRDLAKVPITDFFGSVRNVEIVNVTLDVDEKGFSQNIIPKSQQHHQDGIRRQYSTQFPIIEALSYNQLEERRLATSIYIFSTLIMLLAIGIVATFI